jgi:hypothetical protein
MKLKKLEIELGLSYEEHAGKYKAKVEYEDKTGTFVTILPPEATEALLACIGEQIIIFSARAAEELKKNIFQSIQEARQSPAIEAPTESTS